MIGGGGRGGLLGEEGSKLWTVAPAQAGLQLGDPLSLGDSLSLSLSLLTSEMEAQTLNTWHV